MKGSEGEDNPVMACFAESAPPLRAMQLKAMLNNISHAMNSKRFSAYTLQGQSPSSASNKPLSRSGITSLYHSNIVYG